MGSHFWISIATLLAGKLALKFLFLGSYGHKTLTWAFSNLSRRHLIRYLPDVIREILKSLWVESIASGSFREVIHPHACKMALKRACTGNAGSSWGLDHPRPGRRGAEPTTARRSLRAALRQGSAACWGAMPKKCWDSAGCQIRREFYRLSESTVRWERNDFFPPKNSRWNLSLCRCSHGWLQPLGVPSLLLLPWISGHVSGVLCFQQPPLVLESKLPFLLAAVEPPSMTHDFPSLRSKLGPSFFCCYLPPSF